MKNKRNNNDVYGTCFMSCTYFTYWCFRFLSCEMFQKLCLNVYNAYVTSCLLYLKVLYFLWANYVW
jgi:hypothetical protein